MCSAVSRGVRLFMHQALAYFTQASDVLEPKLLKGNHIGDYSRGYSGGC